MEEGAYAFAELDGERVRGIACLAGFGLNEALCFFKRRAIFSSSLLWPPPSTHPLSASPSEGVRGLGWSCDRSAVGKGRQEERELDSFLWSLRLRVLLLGVLVVARAWV